MTTILMICLGNICRSPLAEVILQDLAHSHQLDWVVKSAGTGAYYHENAPADPGSVMVAKQHQLDLSQHHAHQLTKQALIDSDMIYVMDKENLRDVLALCGSDDTLKSKVKLLLDEIPDFPIREVPDPYRQDMHAFERVFDMIQDACTSIVKKHT